MSFTDEMIVTGHLGNNVQRKAAAHALRVQESRRLKEVIYSPSQNHLLAALPEAEYEHLLRHLELQVLPLGRVLYDSNVNSKFLYFPIDCIVSRLQWAGKRTTEEVAVAGNMGLVGLPLLDKSKLEFCWSMVQVAGHAYVVDFEVLKTAFDREGPLHTLLQRYEQAVMNEVIQTSFCNKHHATLAKVCRWLLLRWDRVDSNELTGTSALIANLLGERYAAVAESMNTLQALDGIECTANRIFVRNRKVLDGLVCDCYGQIRNRTNSCFMQS
jgi:hypothetical protein